MRQLREVAVEALKRALLVDDSELALHFLDRQLQRYGLATEWAHHSGRALELLYGGEASAYDQLSSASQLLSALSSVDAGFGDIEGSVGNAQNQLRESAQALQRLLDHQKRFVRDTSHQLRTPLAVLKTQVQSALREDVPPRQALGEIQETVAGAKVWVLNGPDTLIKLIKLREQLNVQPTGQEFFVLGRVRMRMGFHWKPVFTQRRTRHGNVAACPDCGTVITDLDGEPVNPVALQAEEYRRKCSHCAAPLWTLIRPRSLSGSETVAAGNGDFLGRPESACTKSPARVAEAITVGASDRTDKEASWSNYGQCNDIYAPGVATISALSAGSFLWRRTSVSPMSAALCSP